MKKNFNRTKPSPRPERRNDARNGDSIRRGPGGGPPRHSPDRESRFGGRAGGSPGQPAGERKPRGNDRSTPPAYGAASNRVGGTPRQGTDRPFTPRPPRDDQPERSGYGDNRRNEKTPAERRFPNDQKNGFTSRSGNSRSSDSRRDDSRSNFSPGRNSRNESARKEDFRNGPPREHTPRRDASRTSSDSRSDASPDKSFRNGNTRQDDSRSSPPRGYSPRREAPRNTDSRSTDSRRDFSRGHSERDGNESRTPREQERPRRTDGPFPTRPDRRDAPDRRAGSPRNGDRRSTYPSQDFREKRTDFKERHDSENARSDGPRPDRKPYDETRRPDERRSPERQSGRVTRPASGADQGARIGGRRRAGPRTAGPRVAGPRRSEPDRPSGDRRDGSPYPGRTPRANDREERVDRNQDSQRYETHTNRQLMDASEETTRRANPAEEASDNPASQGIRLNRYVANAGVCSRRDADTLIESGEIRVNGKVIKEMGYRVDTNDVVKYGNRLLNREKMIYVLLNKPKDFLTTTEDPNERKTVMDLVKEAGDQRIYPVGRLDRNTTGLLLLTNDGELAGKLAHPSNEIKKVYQVELDKPLGEEDFEKIKEGLTLEDGPVKVDDLAYVTPDNMVVGVEIHSGRNRLIRRIFEHLGYEVLKLDRTVYAGLSKKDLPRGTWRFLAEKEVIKLKYFQ